MNESITRAAGAEHGEELPPAAMERLIADLGRTSRIRTTLYDDADRERHDAAHAAAPLAPIVLEVAKIRSRSRKELARPR